MAAMLFSTSVIVVVLSALFDAQPFAGLSELFRNKFGREPTVPQPDVFYATTAAECELGVHGLLSSTLLPGTVGIDCEFVESKKSWENWPPEHTVYRVHKTLKKTFIRVISACNMDGYCVVFDMYALAIAQQDGSAAQIPGLLLQLLSANSVTRVCHAAYSDREVLENSFGIKFTFTDPQRQWQKERRPGRIGLDAIVNTMFGVTLSKANQGSDLFWHNNGNELEQDKIKYAAKDAMAALDYYVGLNRETYEFDSILMKMPLEVIYRMTKRFLKED